MEVYFKPSFIKDFKKLPPEIKKEVKEICTKIFPALNSIYDLKIYQTKEIQGFRNYYRIKLGNYRIGFKKEKDSSIKFMRVQDRKDIYRHFP